MAKKNEVKDYFYCMEPMPCSMSDGSGTLMPQCEFCGHYMDCDKCARKNSSLCKNCIVYITRGDDISEGKYKTK